MRQVLAVAITPFLMAASVSALDPRLAAILPVDTVSLEKSLQGLDRARTTLLDQCSRLTLRHRLIIQRPRATTPPTEAEIIALEANLNGFLADRLEAFRESYPNDTAPRQEDYYRQYSSFDLAGWRVIYVNGFYNELMPRSSERKIAAWQQEPAVICDGGEYYFGAEYYPALKMFANFSFNGRYEGRLRLVR
jgi:hypothetical protein